MKKLVVALVTLVLLASLLPYPLARAQEPDIPHEDPAAAQSEFSAYSLLWFYGDILSLVSAKGYADATKLLEKLKHANVPEDLRYIITRYSDLILQLTILLDDLDSLLAEARLLIDEHELETAGRKLDGAAETIQDATDLLEDIEEATATIEERLGLEAAPPESRLAEAGRRISGIMQALERLLEEYEQLLASLVAEAAPSPELGTTEITLELDKAEAWVGESVTARGRLTALEEETKLAGRDIAIRLDGSSFAATTGPDGYYQAGLEVPYKYVDTLTAQAVYSASGEDWDKYLASSSSSIKVNVKFYKTGIEVLAPDQAHPGWPMTVSGQVTSEHDAPLSQRQVEVLLDSQPLAKTETLDGSFAVEIVPHPDTSTGEHILAMAVAPAGLYAGVQEERNLVMAKVPLQIDIRAPALVALPSKPEIRGRVWSELSPAREASVSVTLKDISALATTSENGEFKATLDLPLNLLVLGPQEVVVKVMPVEPWHEPGAAEIRVFVLNMTNIGLLLAVLVSVGVVLYTRRRNNSLGKEKGKSEVLQTIGEEPLEMATPARPETTLEGTEGSVLGAYLRAMRAVEETTPVAMEPWMTLREFLREALPAIGNAGQPFSELTQLAEAVLYSPSLPETEQATGAQSLARRVEETLKKGTP